MADPVQIILEGINRSKATLDAGVAGIEKLDKAANQASRSTNKLVQESDGLGRSLKESTVRVAEFFSAIILERGVEKVFEVLKTAFRETAREAIKFHRTIEDTTISLAAILRTVRPDIFKDFNAALGHSGKLLEELKDKGDAARVGIDEISGVFQQIIEPLTRAGASLREVIDLSGLVVQATKLLPAAERNLTEARALVTGNISERSRLANLLQLTPEEVQNARNTGTLVALLKDRLKEFAIAGDEAQKTFSGALFSIKDILQKDLGAVTESVFQQVKRSLNLVVDFLKGDTFKNVVQQTKEAMGTLADFAGVAIEQISQGNSVQLLSLTIRAALENVEAASLDIFNRITKGIGIAITKAFTVDGIASLGQLMIAYGQLIAQILTTFENAIAAAALVGLGGVRDAFNKLSNATGGILASISPIGVALNALLPKQITFAEQFDKLQTSTAAANTKAGMFLSGLVEIGREKLKQAEDANSAAHNELTATSQLNGLLEEQRLKRKQIEDDQKAASVIGSMLFGNLAEFQAINDTRKKVDDTLEKINDERKRAELDYQRQLGVTRQLLQEGSANHEQAFREEETAGKDLVLIYDELIDRLKKLLALKPGDLGTLQALVEAQNARAAILKPTELQPGTFSQRRDIPFERRFDVFNARDPKTGANDPTIGSGLENFTAKLGTQADRVAAILEGTLGNAISGVSAGITGLITGTQTWGEAMNNTRMAIVNALVQIGVQQVAQFALSKALSGAAKVFAVADAATTAIAWAPASAAANTATFGAASAVGLGVTLAAIAAIIAALSSFDVGGYTGAGGKYQPAGIVHAGEFVMTKEATERLGVSNLYALMRGQADLNEFFAGRRVNSIPMTFPGYAAGGFVEGLSSPINVSPPQVVVFDDKDKFRQWMETPEAGAIIAKQMARRRMDFGLSS